MSVSDTVPLLCSAVGKSRITYGATIPGVPRICGPAAGARCQDAADEGLEQMQGKNLALAAIGGDCSVGYGKGAGVFLCYRARGNAALFLEC